MTRTPLPGTYRSPRAITGLALVLLIALSLITLIFGTYEITPAGVWQVLTGGGEGLDRYIVLNQRLPRLVAALAVGASLGLAGAIFQSVSRNPLGSPDIIGFTTGSATGALLVVLVLTQAGADAETAATGGGIGTGLGAIAGGFLTAALVLLLSARSGTSSAGHKLVLVGIAVGAMLSAFNDFLLTRADLEQAESAKTWLYGSLNALTWNSVWLPAVLTCLAVPLVLCFSRMLRVLELGEDLAAGLGLPVHTATRILMTGAVLLTALSIALAGPIGFVALIAPQLSHRVWRTPGAALWQSALTGALLLVAADYVAGHALAPFQIPVGLVTGALGGAYLLWIIVRKG